MEHNHHHNHNHNEVKTENLLVAALLNLTITVIEIAGGLIANSFGLLSDALHNFGDTIAILLAYLSNKISKRTPTLNKTFGFKRVEILTAMINGIAITVICLFLFYHAIERIRNHFPHANGLLMVIIGVIGLMANFIAMAFLNRDKDINLNVRAAYLHMLSDTLSSVSVIIGGVLIYYFKIYWLDPVLTFIIGIYIFRETWYILKQSYLILIQATPKELDLKKVKSAIENFTEIENVHHIHAWKLNDTQIHFECHVDLKNDLRISDTGEILFNIKQVLKNDFNIEHTTVQFEYNCCEDKSIIKEV